MKKLMITLIVLCIILIGCGNSGVSQEEYDKIIEQNEELQKQNDSLQKKYNELYKQHNELKSSTVNEKETKAQNEESAENKANELNVFEKDTSKDTDVHVATMGERNALSKAKDYLEFMEFSYTGLISQLEYEKYSREEAVYAADNCGADWNEQAAKKAKTYLEFMSFSKDGLIEQLEFEGFTHEQAIYGAEQNGY